MNWPVTKVEGLATMLLLTARANNRIAIVACIHLLSDSYRVIVCNLNLNYKKDINNNYSMAYS